MMSHDDVILMMFCDTMSSDVMLYDVTVILLLPQDVMSYDILQHLTVMSNYRIFWQQCQNCIRAK